jgi:hypothetical protein
VKKLSQKESFFVGGMILLRHEPPFLAPQGGPQVHKGAFFEDQKSSSIFTWSFEYLKTLVIFGDMLRKLKILQYFIFHPITMGSKVAL